ncbi:SDR family oxidoreductase [Solirhodobacter olei]|uniref:SDR family oxidoreductase n=1 Tax=Solirhodobacter olei TaxID=2493082 RepID=UPI000FDCAE63|nr:SDR family oxidoreductase [Solirhodobacter olei]
MTKVILVTGASSGIGRATAQRFLEAGWRVGLIARRAEPLEEVAAAHPGAAALPCDVADPAAVETTFAAAAERFGRIDALFNNAGIFRPAALIDEMPVQDWLDTVQVNLNGMFFCARAAFGHMRRQSPQGGRIINNGSISAHAPRPGSVGYTATKHAVTGLTKTLSLDGRPFDIACGQIDIGNAATEMAAPQAKGVPQADGSIRPEAMMGVGEVADAVLHMASLPLSTNVQFMTIMATKMPFVGRG